MAKTSLRYRAYQHIKDKIIYFDIKPGQKINESDIAQELNISRTPVREAMLMLETEKLIQCNGKAGFLVRKLSPDNAAHYYLLRSVVEKFAAPFIFNNITAAEIRSLEKNLKQAEKAMKAGDLKNFTRYEAQFHQILYESSGSEVVMETLGQLSDKFHWLRAIATHAPGGPESSLSAHRILHKTIKEKDIENYKRQIDQHIANAEAMFKTMQGLFL